MLRHAPLPRPPSPSRSVDLLDGLAFPTFTAIPTAAIGQQIHAAQQHRDHEVNRCVEQAAAAYTAAAAAAIRVGATVASVSSMAGPSLSPPSPPPLRIGVLVPDLDPAEHWVALRALVPAWAAQGHDVAVYARHPTLGAEWVDPPAGGPTAVASRHATGLPGIPPATWIKTGQPGLYADRQLMILWADAEWYQAVRTVLTQERLPPPAATAAAAAAAAAAPSSLGKAASRRALSPRRAASPSLDHVAASDAAPDRAGTGRPRGGAPRVPDAQRLWLHLMAAVPASTVAAMVGSPWVITVPASPLPDAAPTTSPLGLGRLLHADRLPAGAPLPPEPVGRRAAAAGDVVVEPSLSIPTDASAETDAGEQSEQGQHRLADPDTMMEQWAAASTSYLAY
ncbi:hypothetical protein CXG81DRAFT_27672 [Caulochytrium protostelioides]|uniref:Uncharacterized protein n=1 Tax=Caulochytrium protostelioides TaxID=1555241 RepID=A0A4P9X3G2_9FUNG|nr:hypothetical protein CXG81DRAFT_27672 [Caulochytrium protostelioides]|eukprot:RKO99577.1 hypothetical protein CXG81DRAFT_27672 [Caulochytrium protostelioides]